MGQEKSELEIHPGVTQLEYLLSILNKMCSRTAVSVRKGQALTSSELSAKVIEDDEGDKGPMAGVLASLRAAEGLPVLVVACDMPFLDAPVILQLLSRREANKRASCFTGEDGLPEPLCAVYESSALPLLENRLREGRLSLRNFLLDEEVEFIELAKPRLLASVNTPEEADEARQRLRIDLQ